MRFNMIIIHFYAGLRDLAKTARMELSWSPRMSVTDLRNTLCTQYPSIATLLTRSNLAVNDQIVSDDATIPDNAEVALLPPVSGG